MATALYYNLGNSDIELYDIDGICYKRIFNMLDITKQIYKIINAGNAIVDNHDKSFKFDKKIRLNVHINSSNSCEIILKSVNFLMINDFMEYLCTSQKKPSFIYFFYTKQEESSNRQDTIYIYRIVKKLLCEIFRYSEERIKGICIDSNPTDYGELTNVYNNFFKRHKSKIENMENNYFSLTTGTRQMINVLTMKLLDFPHEYYYISEKDGIKELKYFDKVNNEKYLSQIKILIKGLNYSLAEELVIISPFRSNSDIKYLLKIGDWLVNFNIEKANEVCKLVNRNISIKSRISDIQVFDEKLIIIWNLLETSLINKKYLEAVALLFGLLENIRIFIFKQIFNVNINKINGKFVEYENFINNNTDLINFLRNKKIENYTKPNRVVLCRIIEYFSNREINSNQKDILNKYLIINNEVESAGLQDLRNQTPYAHGMEGIQKENIKYLQQISPKIEKLLLKLGVLNKNNTNENIFTELNNSIIDIIRDDYLI